MNKKFIWLIVSCLMVAALVLASCAPVVVEEKKATVVTKEPEKKAEEVEEVVEKPVGPQYGGIITTLIGRNPLSWDILDLVILTHYWNSFTYDMLLECDWWIDRSIANYRHKYQYFDESLWVGKLAESWEQPDNLTIIFYLRKGVRFQNIPPVNGREFVANDVVKVFERWMGDPRLAKDVVTQTVASVSASDKYTVVFKLRRPSAAIMSEIGVIKKGNMAAHEVWEEFGNLRDWRHQIGTGPWIITNYIPDSSVSYKRNPDYWKKDPAGNQLPYADGLKVLIIPDLATQIAALRTGKIDLTGYENQVSRDQQPSIATSNPEMEWALVPADTPVVINFKNTTTPFNDIRVRRATSMAINRQEISDNIFGGGADVFAFPCYPTWASFTPLNELPEDVQKYWTYNPEEAKVLLAEAGYATGLDINAVYTATGRWSVYGPVMELVKDYFADVGINLELRPVDAATAAATKVTREYDHILAVGVGMQSELKTAAVHWYTPGLDNFSEVSDPIVDKLVDEALMEPDFAKRTALLKELYIHLSTQVFDIALPAPEDFTAWQPWLKGYSGESACGNITFGQTLAHIWLDQDLRKEMVGR